MTAQNGVARFGWVDQNGLGHLDEMIDLGGSYVRAAQFGLDVLNGWDEHCGLNLLCEHREPGGQEVGDQHEFDLEDSIGPSCVVVFDALNACVDRKVLAGLNVLADHGEVVFCFGCNLCDSRLLKLHSSDSDWDILLMETSEFLNVVLLGSYSLALSFHEM